MAMRIVIIKNLSNFCLLISAAFVVTACSVIFPGKVPPAGEVRAPIDDLPYWEQHFSEHAIINQQPPLPPMDDAPV